MAILSILLTVVIVAVSILMVLVVLIQRPKQEGLGAAFGGSTLDSALGAHTSDVLQKITTWLGILFFVSAIGLAMLKTREFRASAANNVLEEVQDREPVLPGLPPELSNLPAFDSPAPAAPAPKAPAADEKKAADKAPADPKPAAKSKAKPSAEPKEKAKGGKAKEGAKGSQE
tara:strand:- start:378 stop:896 length:519 start_codon:yes stop_codon:yes gene_type:complete